MEIVTQPLKGNKYVSSVVADNFEVEIVPRSDDYDWDEFVVKWVDREGNAELRFVGHHELQQFVGALVYKLAEIAVPFPPDEN